MRICLVILGLTFLLPTTVPGQTVTGPMVRFRTTQGDIDVTLLPNSAPKTVANFLNYVNRGAFNNSVFHRSVAGFIIQGGGYTWQNLTPIEIPSDPPIANEYSVSNIRGTLAMAKLPSGPDTATNQ
ncbi:MAG: peptidylprolyl isomerase, partial [Bryobacteraceae bacterium]|nr:peptidylprolyl isomerase [Bryobacteraceae bacterium]